jgi:tripartite-type tricarboxylate transporter receptor subunit TctC
MPTGYEYWEYKNWRGIPRPPGTTEAEAKKFWATVPKDVQATRVTSFKGLLPNRS